MKFLLIGILLPCLIINQVKSISVLCYYATWAISREGDGQFLPEDLDPNLCTHINYAFLGLNDDGSLQILDNNVDVEQGGLKRVSALKEINPNLKTILSVGGYAAGTAVFTAVSSDPEKRANMVKSTLEFLETYNYDGLDVDWEYPLEGDRQNYITLLQELKDAFEPNNYILTVAVAAIPTDAAYNVPAMSSVLDIINVMTYDFHSSWSGSALHHSPLYAHPTEGEWQKDNLNSNSSITHWIESGADPQKLAIGIAFYGHAFILADPSQHDIGALTNGPADAGEFTNNAGTLGYSEICYFHSEGEVGWEDTQKIPYLFEDSLWVGYDNEDSIALKVKYAKDNNLGGVMIWSIDTDDKNAKCGVKNGLLEAINKNL